VTSCVVWRVALPSRTRKIPRLDCPEIRNSKRCPYYSGELSKDNYRKPPLLAFWGVDCSKELSSLFEPVLCHFLQCAQFVLLAAFHDLILLWSKVSERVYACRALFRTAREWLRGYERGAKGRPEPAILALIARAASWPTLPLAENTYVPSYACIYVRTIPSLTPQFFSLPLSKQSATAFWGS
jgi:hypothetical protein